MNLNLNDSDYSMRSNFSASNLSLASSASVGTWIILDVAGKEFKLLKPSLSREPDSILAKIVEEDVDPDALNAEYQFISYDPTFAKWLLDSNPEYFEYIVKYLRHGRFNGIMKAGHEIQDLIDEAEMYKLNKLVEICQHHIHMRNQSLCSLRSPSQSSYYTASQQSILHPPPGIFQQLVAPPPGFESPMSSHYASAQSINTITSATVIKNSFPNANLRHFNMAPKTEKPDDYEIPTILPKLQEEELETVMNVVEDAQDIHLKQVQNKAENVCPEMESQISKNAINNMWAEEDYDVENLESTNNDDADSGEYIPPESVQSEEEESVTNDENIEFEDVESTIFQPPANYCQLIDTAASDQERRKATMVPFELQHGKIQNYEDIKGFRQYCVKEFLKSIKSGTSYHDSKYGDSVGDVIFYLQQLYVLYPDGCTVREFAAYENSMKMAKYARKADKGTVVLSGSKVPTVVSLLESGFLNFARSGKLMVNPKICDVHLFCLRHNLCSNLFRYLYSNAEVNVRDAIAKMRTVSPKIRPECILSIVNCYPAIFNLVLEPHNDCLFETAMLHLNVEVLTDENLKWRLLLDCDVTNGENKLCNYGHCG